MSVLSSLSSYQSRTRKPAKQKVDDKEEVYDDPDPVSEEFVK